MRKVPSPAGNRKISVTARSLSGCALFVSTVAFLPNILLGGFPQCPKFFSRPNPSPRGIPTKSATRSQTPSSTPSWRRTPVPALPARRPAPPASSTSWARSRPAATWTSPARRARSSAPSAMTAPSTALTATPAASSPTSTARAPTLRWAPTTTWPVRATRA